MGLGLRASGREDLGLELRLRVRALGFQAGKIWDLGGLGMLVQP